MDATEILKSNAAAAAAAEAAWVNPRDPAKALGDDGQPLRSRRAPTWADVPNEQWDDWRWQLSNRVNSLEEIGEILELTDDEREGLSAEGKFRVDITPYFISLIDPKDPNDPIRRSPLFRPRPHSLWNQYIQPPSHHHRSYQEPLLKSRDQLLMMHRSKR
jgi:L-lysine 2,3-aminomutase